MEKNLNTHSVSKRPQKPSEAELKLKKLELRILELKDIADEINPYGPLPLSMKEKLEKLGIPLSLDPFKMTNTLLLMMEDSIEQRGRLRRELNLDPDAPLKTSSPPQIKH